METLQNSHETEQQIIQSNDNLTQVEKTLITTNLNNRKSFNDLGQSLLQNNQVVDKFSENIKRADQLNTKALGTSITPHQIVTGKLIYNLIIL